MSDDDTEHLKPCLGLILYGIHLKCIAVKAIAYTGFQQGCKSKSIFDRLGKILFSPTNLVDMSERPETWDFEMWTTECEAM